MCYSILFWMRTAKHRGSARSEFGHKKTRRFFCQRVTDFFLIAEIKTRFR